MRPITAPEIWPNAVYEKARDEFRQRVMALKAQRRLHLGENVTLVFENRETLRFQIQEMLRAEGIQSPQGIQEELEVYNPLLPATDALSATLFIEVVEETRIREVLHRLLGIEETLFLTFAGQEVRARFEEGRTDGEKLSAVQYVRFVFEDDQRKRFLDASAASLELRHPNLQAKIELGPDTLRSLQSDLTAE